MNGNKHILKETESFESQVFFYNKCPVQQQKPSNTYHLFLEESCHIFLHMSVIISLFHYKVTL